MDRNQAFRSRNGPKSSFSGWDGRGVCRGRGGWGVVREKNITKLKLIAANSEVNSG